jgi:hypothetical protein
MPFDEIKKLLQKTLEVKRVPLYVPELQRFLIHHCVRRLYYYWQGSSCFAKEHRVTLADRVFSIEKAERELGFYPKKTR